MLQRFAALLAFSVAASAALLAPAHAGNPKPTSPAKLSIGLYTIDAQIARRRSSARSA